MTGGNSFAVNAFRHVSGSFVMALAAGLSQSRIVQGRFRGTGRQDGVSVVAIAAGSRVLFAASQRQAMNACTVTFRLLLVALSAVWRLRRQVVIRVPGRDVAVTTCTGVGLMNRGGELARIDEHRNPLPRRVGPIERLVGVTFHAGAVLDLLSRHRSARAANEKHTQSQNL